MLQSSLAAIGLDLSKIDWFDGLLYRARGIISSENLGEEVRVKFEPGSWVCSREWELLTIGEYLNSIAATQSRFTVSLLELPAKQLEACRNLLGKQCLDLSLLKELRQSIAVVSEKPIIRAFRRPIDGPSPSTTCEWAAYQRGEVKVVGLHRDALGESHSMFNLGLFDRFFTFVSVAPEDGGTVPWEALKSVDCWIVRLQPGWGFIMTHPQIILHDGVLTHQGPDYVLQVHEAAATTS